MPILRVVCSLENDSGLPEDRVQNTFHVNHDGIQANPTFDNIMEQFATFYETIDGYLSGVLQPTLTIRLYRLSDPEPRTPIDSMTRLLTLTGVGSYPEEVAVCLSFQAEPEAGVRQSRRRGRVYIGPLNQSTGESAVVNRPTSAFRGDLRAAGFNLVNGLAAIAPTIGGDLPTWLGVYSTVSGTIARVRNGWVDDAWDIQRRRGPKPTARTTFTT